MRTRLPVLLALGVAFIVHDSLPHGLFGAYDMPMRIVVAGATAGVTMLAIQAFTRLQKRRA